MGKTLLTLSAAFAFSLAVFAQSGTEGQDNHGNKDTLAVTWNVDARYYRPAAPDSTRHCAELRTIDRNAVNIPKQNAFNEKMKEDGWLGDILKGIIFR